MGRERISCSSHIRLPSSYDFKNIMTRRITENRRIRIFSLPKKKFVDRWWFFLEIFGKNWTEISRKFNQGRLILKTNECQTFKCYAKTNCFVHLIQRLWGAYYAIHEITSFCKPTISYQDYQMLLYCRHILFSTYACLLPEDATSISLSSSITKFSILNLAEVPPLMNMINIEKSFEDWIYVEFRSHHRMENVCRSGSWIVCWIREQTSIDIVRRV